MNNFYTLEDLKREGIPTVSGKPAKLAVIGHPIVQSRSPQMQQAALDVAELPVSYIRIDSPPEELEETITFLRGNGFVGTNITVPNKTQAAHLSESSDPLVLATGSANTLVFSDNKVTSFNTDGPGFAQAIKETFSVDLKDLNVVLLGANGGAGVALAHTCVLHQCPNLTLVGRSMEKLQPIYDQLQGANATSLHCCTFGSEELAQAIADADLIINATSLGLKPTDPSPIPAELITSKHLVYDIVTHETALQIQARERGAKVSDGLSMLIYQGALSFEHWFGIKADIKAMHDALS
jgi:shikimate dehydrogenase